MKSLNIMALSLSLISSSIIPCYAQEQLTPQEKVIRQQLMSEYDFSNKSEKEISDAVKLLASQQPDDYYHEQDIIEHLRDKLKMMENDGHFIPSKEAHSILPTDGPINSDTNINDNTNAISETLRFSTNPIAGYDNNKLGIEVLRRVDFSASPAKIIIGLRIFSSDKFERAIESTSIVLNSDMDPTAARLKMDQAINTVARLTGNKISYRLNPEETEQLVLTIGGFGSVAIVSTFIWAIQKVFKKGRKSRKFFFIAMAVSWAASIVNSIYLEETGDYNYLEKEMD